MTDINSIKNLRNNHGKSIKKISEILNIDWRTAKKYADGEENPQPIIKKRTGMMYTEKWGEIVSSWLEEDNRMRKKLRRSRKQLFEELKELGYLGSYRTLCSFVQEWYQTHVSEESYDEGFERLEHPPAEAQLDFGTMEVVKNGEAFNIKTLIMTFPYSNNGFVYALPAENQECLLEGLNKIFEQVGGVPRKIRIDNMATAVVKSKHKGKDAILTDEFLRFASYYSFEVQTCNPRSGHEKGSVENKVGYIRYNYFSESPVFKDFDTLNVELKAMMYKDRQREHYQKGKTIGELWEEEKPLLIALPEQPYNVFKQVTLKVNKYNEVRIDNTSIHVPMAKNYAIINCILRPYEYSLLDGNGKEITNGYRPYLDKKKPIEWGPVFQAWKRKPATMTYSRYWKYLPERIKLYLNQKDYENKMKNIDIMGNLLSTYSLEEVNIQFYELIGANPQSKDLTVDMTHYDLLVQGGSYQ